MASEENKGGRSRSRKANMKGPKKTPQRGMGVAMLERLRALHDPHPIINLSGSVPVRSGPPSSTMHPHQHVINANNTYYSGSGSWFVPNMLGSGPPLLLGTPLETSKELSSIPNLLSQPKRTRFNEDSVKGSNVWKDMLPNPSGHDFVGLMPQPATPNFFGQTTDFYNKFLARHDAVDAYATPNLDECAEVVAVHMRGNSVSGRVFKEYEFLPIGTTSKEIKVPTVGSVAEGSEASSIIATPYGPIDLSLKL